MQVRPYNPSDKEALRAICRETARQEFKKFPRLMRARPVIYNDYFTEQEPEHVFVLADDADMPVGYILCAADYEKFTRLMNTEYRRRVREEAPYMTLVITFYLRRLKTLRETPAHLHIDILPAYQRQGWGTKLVLALCERLRAEGVPALSVFDIPKSAGSYPLCTRLGFRVSHRFAGGAVNLTKKL